MGAVLFGDIEDAVIIWLNAHLTVDAYDRVPSVTNDMLSFVIIERTGGPAVTVVSERATLIVEAWAKSWRSAQDLMQLARQAVHDLPGEIVAGVAFSRVDEFAGPARLPDAVSGYPRFTMTVSVTVRPTA